MSLLEIRDLRVVYHPWRGRAVCAVDGVTLSVAAAEIVGVVGEPGCGKSSLARAAVGLRRPTSGQVLFDGQPLHAPGRWARAPRDVRLQLVLQDPFASLNPRRTVGDQVADALAIHAATPRQPADPARTGEPPPAIDELLRRVGLPATLAGYHPSALSGGQRQRVAIARALAAAPKVIVLDEPFATLEASDQAQVANLLIGLAADLNIGVLLLSPDLAMIRHLAQRTAIMYLGQVVETARTPEVWSAPLHPYTRALIDAIPHVVGGGGGGRRLPQALAGAVADPGHPPNGCRFHPRCPYVLERCPFDAPELQSPTPEHRVACWLHDPAQPIRPLPERTSA